MTRRNIYLLVPQKGTGSFVGGIAADKIEVIGGRANAEKRREAFERELNGGKTWNEALQASQSKEDVENVRNNLWHVHSDTDRNWSDFRQYNSWNVQDRVEALLNQ